MLGCGDGIAERRIHHDDALGGGGGNVNVINADTGAANHLQVGGIGQNFVRDFGGRANGQPVIIADDFGELVFILAQIGLEIDLNAALFKNSNGGGGKGIRNKNAGHGRFPYGGVDVCPHPHPLPRREGMREPLLLPLGEGWDEG